MSDDLSEEVSELFEVDELLDHRLDEDGTYEYL